MAKKKERRGETVNRAKWQNGRIRQERFVRVEVAALLSVSREEERDEQQ
jgi:hypothetical protein